MTKRVLLFLFLCVSWVYPFGKNKVNYHVYDWRVLQTDHFLIYLTKSDLFLTNEIVSTAEAIFHHHEVAFSFSPKRKIKLVIYPNQIDFQQNNIITDWIGEATGGFTEFVKQRVVIPYSGDFANFYHILAHELNHAFQGFTWGKGDFSMYTIRDIDIPLWLVEGASEYNSIGLDKECEMMISDAVINGYLPDLKELSDLNSLNPNLYFFVYKEGQLFYHFLEEKYGSKIYADLNQTIAEFKNFDTILTNLFKKNLDEINAEFMDYVRKKYQPHVSDITSVDVVGKKALMENSYFNMNPVFIDSENIAFISDRKVYSSIVTYNLKTRRLRRLVKGGFDEDYLEFHYGTRNNLSVSSNKELCFVSRSGGSDVIHIYDFKTKNMDQIKLPFRIVNSPEISRDGRRVVFSALKNQSFDIFIYDRDTKKITPVTDDKFFDNQPRWLGNDRLVFASNRKDGISNDNLYLIILNLRDLTVERIIDTGFSDNYPTVSPDGRFIAFVKNDINPSLMMYEWGTGKMWQELVPQSGIFSPAFGEKNRMVFTVYNNNSFNIYLYKPKLETESTNFASLTNQLIPDLVPFSFASIQTNRSYRTELTMDNLIGAFSLNTSLGMALVGIFTMSDILGNHRFQLLMDTVIEIQENFWDYINFDFTWLNLKHRFDMGMQIFNYSNYFYEFNTLQSFFDMETPYARSYGVFYFFSYPFTTFDRVQASIGVRGFQFIESMRIVGTNVEYTYSYQNRDLLELAYVHDATLENVTGPIDGIRFELSLSKSFAILTNSINYTRLVFDYRQYIMIVPGYNFALRGVLGKVLGTDKDEIPFYLGGFNSVRGYELWQFQGDTLLLFNIEFRFPLIMDMTLGFPLPIRLPIIWGVLFWDFGAVWNIEQESPFFAYENEQLVFEGLKSGLGMGMRLVLLPGIKLILDFAVPYRGVGILPLDQWKTYFQIGVDF